MRSIIIAAVLAVVASVAVNAQAQCPGGQCYPKTIQGGSWQYVPQTYEIGGYRPQRTRWYLGKRLGMALRGAFAPSPQIMRPYYVPQQPQQPSQPPPQMSPPQLQPSQTQPTQTISFLDPFTGSLKTVPYETGKQLQCVDGKCEWIQ